MRARMEELSIFFEENLDDEKIMFFEKLRLKIKKSLHNKPGKQKQALLLQQLQQSPAKSKIEEDREEIDDSNQNDDLFARGPQLN